MADTMQSKLNKLTAIKMLGQFSKHYDTWGMMGPVLANMRQELMTLLVGKKLPKAKCGVTEIRSQFFRLSGIANFSNGHCLATHEDFLAQWCKDVLIIEESNCPVSPFIVVHDVDSGRIAKCFCPDLTSACKYAKSCMKLSSGKNLNPCVYQLVDDFWHLKEIPEDIS